MKPQYTSFPANKRGHANHGWLDTYHTFSFAQYHHPERVQFGALRVFNDDKVAAGMGFGEHPHQNMEIISIPISGALAHRDSMGNEGVIQTGEVQVMSAGTGIQHSEYNASKTEVAKFFQIWIFPDQAGVEPRYDQQNFSDIAVNQWTQIIGPKRDAKDGLWIHQDAWIHLAEIEAEQQIQYQGNSPDSGLFVFAISGKVAVDGHPLASRDALGVKHKNSIDVKANSACKLLLIEVPM